MHPLKIFSHSPFVFLLFWGIHCGMHPLTLLPATSGGEIQTRVSSSACKVYLTLIDRGKNLIKRGQEGKFGREFQKVQQKRSSQNFN